MTCVFRVPYFVFLRVISPMEVGIKPKIGVITQFDLVYPRIK